jgi:hypothetical protein
VLKLAALAVATWLSTVFAALVMFMVAAGMSGKSVRSGETAVAILLGLTALELLTSVLVVYLLGRRFVPETGPRIVVVLVFGIVQTMTFAVLGFMFLVGFNR